jgi:hypothetical protein
MLVGLDADEGCCQRNRPESTIEEEQAWKKVKVKQNIKVPIK